jgi:hypothetical protein
LVQIRTPDVLAAVQRFGATWFDEPPIDAFVPIYIQYWSGGQPECDGRIRVMYRTREPTGMSGKTYVVDGEERFVPTYRYAEVEMLLDGTPDIMYWEGGVKVPPWGLIRENLSSNLLEHPMSAPPEW